MKKLNQPEDMFKQISATHSVLAKQIIAREHTQYKPRATTVAKHWLESAPKLTRIEWIAGARSLITHYSIYEPSRVSDVENILQPFDQMYFDSRKGKHQFVPHETNEVEQATAKLKNSYCHHDELPHIEPNHADPDFHGATRGGLRTFITSWWRVKHNIGGAPHDDKA